VRARQRARAQRGPDQAPRRCLGLTSDRATALVPQAIFRAQGGAEAPLRSRHHAIVVRQWMAQAKVPNLADLGDVPLDHPESGLGGAGSEQAGRIRDPIAWWHDHGVDSVIFIEPGNDDGGTAPISPLPDRPIEGESLSPGEWDYERPQARLAAVLKTPALPPPPDLEAASPTPFDLDAPKLGRGAVLAGSGSLFRAEWKYDRRDTWRSADWCLVPYVNPVQDAQRTAFRTAILAHLGLTNPTPIEFRKRVPLRANDGETSESRKFSLTWA
jgi:hypothetical protein